MTKEQLNKYYFLVQEIKNIEEKINEINYICLNSSKIHAMKYEKHLSNPQKQRMMLIEKYEQKLDIARNKALEELIKIEEYINGIEDPETRMIFRYRYIEFKKWNEISKFVHLSRTVVFERHKRQLELNKL